MSLEDPPRPKPTSWEFNKEIIFGEAGSLAGAYVAAITATHLTRRPALISASLIPGALIGGTLFWLAARIAHQRARGSWSLGGMARDIGYFTPVAALLSFFIYDPAIFLASHFLLVRGAGLALSVVVGQVTAFSLFLGSMNVYRMILAHTGTRHL